ncbi:hypothetical protein BD779DRAFT_575511 [Infundibulicybe gibba]|nr:hypothetical protein BD779DRAFT_575511 [Infundibulicybe gibba]
MNDDYANAVAGPSSPRPDNTSSAPHAQPPSLFLPPAGPPQPISHLSSTQDLLARFRLLPAYDKYVRPFAAPADSQPDSSCVVASSIPNSAGVVDKGKGRELAPAAQAQAPGGMDGDDDEAGVKGEKKWRNNYKHLIKGIPGKHSLKKDDYLSTMMQVPPKQRIPIIPFDSRTQRDAFSVSLEGLKGWNPGALVLESAQAREDRKKRSSSALQKLKHMLPSRSPKHHPQLHRPPPRCSMRPNHRSKPPYPPLPPSPLLPVPRQQQQQHPEQSQERLDQPRRFPAPDLRSPARVRHQRCRGPDQRYRDLGPQNQYHPRFKFNKMFNHGSG